jgi:hypothetical protein
VQLEALLMAIFFLLCQISEYVQHNDAILLVVIPAIQAPEISSSRALRIAKEYDAESESMLSLHHIFLSKRCIILKF